MTRHFTATTFIVCKNKVLLHLHKSLNKWLPVGGHIDRDELPGDAARREVREESGLDVEFYKREKLFEMKDARELQRPMHLLLEDINPFHQHIDFIYFARSDSFDVNPQDGETRNLKWFSAEEVESLDDCPENVKVLAAEAISLLCY
jgi:ADP-ribose pyrophosphatase YjhB (NUDIX family)